MTFQRILRAREVCALLGTTTKDGTFPYPTLNGLIKRGIILPVAGGDGTGDHRCFQFAPDVLSLVVGRGLRGKGYSESVAAGVMDRIREYEADTLAEMFAQGRSYLMIFGDEVAPRFSTQTEVNEIWHEHLPDSPADWFRQRPAAINVKLLSDKLLALLDGMKRKEVVSAEPTEVVA